MHIRLKFMLMSFLFIVKHPLHFIERHRSQPCRSLGPYPGHTPIPGLALRILIASVVVWPPSALELIRDPA